MCIIETAIYHPNDDILSRIRMRQVLPRIGIRHVGIITGGIHAQRHRLGSRDVLNTSQLRERLHLRQRDQYRSDIPRTGLYPATGGFHLRPSFLGLYFHESGQVFILNGTAQRRMDRVISLQPIQKDTGMRRHF